MGPVRTEVGVKNIQSGCFAYIQYFDQKTTIRDLYVSLSRTHYLGL